MYSLDYLAGFFDGEGYIGMIGPSGRQGHRLQASVGNVWKEVLEEYQNRWGGFLYQRKPFKTKQTTYDWHLNGNTLVGSFLKEIYPHLKFKQSQAWLGLEYLEQRTSLPKRNRYSIIDQELFDSEMALRNGFLLALKLEKGRDV